MKDDWGTLGQGYRWTDLEEVHIFADGLNKKGANGEAEMSVFALSGLPKFSEKARCARLCQAGRADTHTHLARQSVM